MVLNKITAHPVSAGLLATGLFLLPLGVSLLAPMQVLVSLPLLLVAVRRGHRAGWQAVAVMVACAFFIGGGVAFPAMVFLLFAGFPLLAAWLWRAGWKTSHCALAAFLIGAVTLFGVLVWAWVVGLDLPVQLASALNVLKEALLTSLAANQGVDALALTEFRHSLDQLVALISLLFPAFVLMGWFLVQIGNLLLARFFLNRWGENRMVPEDLTALRLPFSLVWAVIIMALLALVSRGSLHDMGVNLGVFLSVPYFFQGLAVIQQAFVRYKVGGFMRGVIFVALFLWTGMALLVLLLGLFDTWIDFRRRFLQDKEGDGSSGR